MTSNTSFFFQLFLCVLFPTIVAADAALDANAISPIRHLEPSLAASRAQSTALAIKLEGGDVLLVTRTPIPSKSNPLHVLVDPGDEDATDRITASEKNDNEDDLVWTPLDPYRPTNDKLLHIWSPTVCACLTGWAADVQHVSRSVAKHVMSHEQIFNTGAGGIRSMSVHQLVKRVFALELQRVALFNGARPLAIQGLVVGVDTIRGPDDSSETEYLVMYTVDPSGNWRHFGGRATAVGSKAPEVRKHLYERLKKLSLATAKEAIQSAIETLFEAGSTNADASIQVIRIQAPQRMGVCRFARLHPKNVQQLKDQVSSTK